MSQVFGANPIMAKGQKYKKLSGEVYYTANQHYIFLNYNSQGYIKYS